KCERMVVLKRSHTKRCPGAYSNVALNSKINLIRCLSAKQYAERTTTGGLGCQVSTDQQVVTGSVGNGDRMVRGSRVAEKQVRVIYGSGKRTGKVGELNCGA